MINKTGIIILVYVPCILSIVFTFDPILSYIIAWLGSFYIFYITIFSSLSPLKLPLNTRTPVMSPLILIQLIFAGFMCSTSIFYFIEHIDEEIDLISECQRLSLLAHASLITGMILTIKSKNSILKSEFKPSPALLLWICLCSYTFAKGLDHFPILIQFKYPLQVLSITSAVYLLIKGIFIKKYAYAMIAFIMFSMHFIESTLTGFKEGIIVQILILAFITFHHYKRLVVLAIIPILFIALYILPTYTTIMRVESWTNGRSTTSAREQAYQTFFNEESDQIIIENNWMFLTNRFSEIGMFVKYIKHTPDHHDYIGIEILENVIGSLIPRFLWPEKPNTEQIAMQRVYEAGVVSRSSIVSAKTRPVVDGYLISGATGVLLTMVAYGIVTQLLYNTAEKLFGGYELGGIIIFNSLFQQLWRGNTLEFLVNNIVCGFLLMIIIYFMMNLMNVFSKKSTL